MPRRNPRIGDVVETPLGQGRVCLGAAHGKPPARGGKWVFLFWPEHLHNRVICFHPSQVRLVPRSRPKGLGVPSVLDDYR